VTGVLRDVGLSESSTSVQLSSMEFCRRSKLLYCRMRNGEPMRTIITASTIFVALTTAGTTPIAGQPQWAERAIDNGVTEFRLSNDEGASVILVCSTQGLSAGFEFPTVLEATERASVRGIPGERQNIPVAPIGDRMLQIAGGRGLDFTLELLREAANLSVRAGGESASFEVFGSASIVAECVDQIEDATQNPARR